MSELGVFSAILPGDTDIDAFARLVAAGAPPDPLLRVAALFRGNVDMLADRLKLATAEKDRLAELRDAPTPRDVDDDAALRRLLAEWPASVLLDRLWLTERDSCVLRHRIEAMPKPIFPLRGETHWR